jgi:hypothetical protein
MVAKNDANQTRNVPIGKDFFQFGQTGKMLSKIVQLKTAPDKGLFHECNKVLIGKIFFPIKQIG